MGDSFWSRRSQSSGVFREAKAQGGSLKGVRPPVKRRWTDYVAVVAALVGAATYAVQQDWSTVVWALLAGGFAGLSAGWKHDYFEMKRDYEIEQRLRR